MALNKWCVRGWRNVPVSTGHWGTELAMRGRPRIQPAAVGSWCFIDLFMRLVFLVFPLNSNTTKHLTPYDQCVGSCILMKANPRLTFALMKAVWKTCSLQPLETMENMEAEVTDSELTFAFIVCGSKCSLATSSLVCKRHLHSCVFSLTFLRQKITVILI